MHSAPILRDHFDLPARFEPKSTDIRPSAPSLQTFIRRGDVPAKHWHNRYIAWQNREKRQQEERQKLVEERKRIFGGESDENDEDDICSKMMEYFNGLDYIDSER